MNKLLLILLLFSGYSYHLLAQIPQLVKVRPKTHVVDFVLQDQLSVRKTIYAHEICSRSNGHIFVPGPASGIITVDLVCYNMDAIQIGPILDSSPVPHFDRDACLVRLKYPKDKKTPYAIMYKDGSVRYLPYTYCSDDGFVDGLAVVSKGGKFCLIDQYGNIKAEGYDKIGPLKEGRRAVRKSNKWGFVNADCSVVIEPQYWEVGVFSDNVTWVRKDVLSKPFLIDRSGKPQPFANPLLVNISEVYDFIDNEALVITEDKDGGLSKQLINKSGFPILVRDFYGDIFLTDFDNKHAEYFFDEKDEDGAVLYYCSTKGNRVNGLTDFRRKDAFRWEQNQGHKSWKPTAQACWVDIDADGDFYTEDHTVFRCNNPEEDHYVFKDEEDGIALWEYKGTTYVSSSIRVSEKTELGAEFRNVVRIADPKGHKQHFSTTASSLGYAQTPNDDGADTDVTDSETIDLDSNLNQENSEDNKMSPKNATLTLSKIGCGNVLMSANGNPVESGTEVAIGTQVTIVCTPTDANSVLSIKLNGSDLSTSVDGKVWSATFSTPAGHSIISVEFTSNFIH